MIIPSDLMTAKKTQKKQDDYKAKAKHPMAVIQSNQFFFKIFLTTTTNESELFMKGK